MNTVSFARRETARRDYESLCTGFGPQIFALLNDPLVTDVMLNGDGALYEDRQGHGLKHIGSMNAHDARSIINLIAAIAGETVGRESLIIEAELPIRNARFIGFIPPITALPSFSIRLPSPKIYTFNDYVHAGIATEQHIEIIEQAISDEHNILVAGGTKSGKTTLLNAILDGVHRIYPDKRVGLIEEIIELQFSLPNVLALRTGANADHQDLLKRLMRARPDIIVFGEVRDKAALQLVKASNTGHGSVFSTIHANTPLRALGRMEDLCAEAIPGVNFRSQIADAIGVVIGIQRFDPKTRQPDQPERQITQIIKIEGTANDDYDFTILA